MTNITIKGRTATKGGSIWQTPQGETALVSIGVNAEETTWHNIRGYGNNAKIINNLQKGERVEVSGTITTEQRWNKSTLRNYDVEILVIDSITQISASKKLVLKKK
jgi:single-stranded DNA-binding protein